MSLFAPFILSYRPNELDLTLDRFFVRLYIFTNILLNLRGKALIHRNICRIHYFIYHFWNFIQNDTRIFKPLAI